MSKYRVVIGRAESIDLIGLATDVPAKIDTGAYRSAIHVSGLKIVQQNDREILKADLLGHPCAPLVRQFETSNFNVRTVRNSTGDSEQRYEISLKIKMGPKVFTASFTLSDRRNNVFPILIGRTALIDRFLVDVSATGISRKELKRMIGTASPGTLEDLE